MSCARGSGKTKQIWGKREMGVRVKKGKNELSNCQ
jgi:hypothetical protein